MYTNQAVDPANLRPPELACRHAPGEGSADTCSYLRMIGRVREWADRAEREHRAGRGDANTLGELWLLYAEVSTAHDLCPDHAGRARAH